MRIGRIDDLLQDRPPFPLEGGPFPWRAVLALSVLSDFRCPRGGFRDDRLYRGWTASHRGGIGAARRVSHIERLLEPLPAAAGLITVIDAHPATLSWLASVRR